MADIYSHHEGGRGMQQHQFGQGFNQGGRYQQGQQHYQSNSPRAHQIAKAATSATAGGLLLVLSGLTLAGTIISLILATPLLVIFSPVLVPAVITTFLLVTGFLTSGGFGVAAATVLMWMYRYATDRHPSGADTMDDTAQKLASKIREKGEHGTGGGHYGTTGTGHYATGGAHHTGGIGAGGHVGYQT